MNSEFGSKKQMVFVETLNFDRNPDQYQVSNWNFIGSTWSGEGWVLVSCSMERQVVKLTVDLTWMTWNEGIEMKNWNEGLEMNDFTGMNWNEAIAQSCVRFLSEIELWLQSRAHFVKFFEAVSFKGFYLLDDDVVDTWNRALATGFARLRVFASADSRVPDLLHFPTTWMMCLAWWLSWGCGCQDGETASHDNRP